MTVARTLTYNLDHEKQKSLPSWVFDEDGPTYDNKFRPMEQLDVPERFYNDLDSITETLNESTEQDDVLFDASLSPNLLNAKSDVWDSNPNPVLSDFVSNLQNNNLDTFKEPLASIGINQHLRKNPDNDDCYLLLSTNLVLKKKRHMFYFSMDFGELTIDGLVDTGALTSAISESDLNKIKLLSNSSIINTGPPPDFKIMVANGQLEDPLSTVELQFEMADWTFREGFIVMKDLPHPLIGLCFLHRHDAVFDIRQGILTFPQLSMQLRAEFNTPPRPPTALVTRESQKVYPQETVAIALTMPHLLDHDATGILTPSKHFDNHDTIFITASLSKVNHNAIGIHVTNFSDAPYTIATDTHVADFSVLTPEQIKHVKPVNHGELNFMLNLNSLYDVQIQSFSQGFSLFRTMSKFLKHA